MAYNTQTYWIFGLFPSSGIQENRKHDVSETGSVSILRWGGRHSVMPQWLRLARFKGSNWVGVFPLTWGWKRIQFPKRHVFYFLEYWAMEKVQKPSNFLIKPCSIKVVVQLDGHKALLVAKQSIIWSHIRVYWDETAFILNFGTYSRSWALLEKPLIVRPLKNSVFHGTRRFNTVFTRDLHWSLSWAISIQYTPSHPISLRSILILSTHLHFGLPSRLFPS
jgi:hypothetical protein